MMTMQQKLKALLADRKQKVIAIRAGIHPVTLSTYLNHNAKPSSNVAVRLADALGVDCGWLLDPRREEWPPPPCKNPTIPPAPAHASAA